MNDKSHSRTAAYRRRARSRYIEARPRDMRSRPGDVGTTPSRKMGMNTPGIVDGVSSPHVAMDQDPANPDRHVTQALQGVLVIVCDSLSSSEHTSEEMESSLKCGYYIAAKTF